MIIQYCSDLHLEFPENRQFLANKPLVPRAKVLLLAGDIVPFNELSIGTHDAFFDLLSANFHRIYWVPGNHEYYRGDAQRRSGSFVEYIRPNFHLLNNMVVEEENVRLIFSTLWSHIGPRYEWDIQQSLNDFHVINYGGRPILPADVNHLHTESLDFIKSELARPTTMKTVVVTHHVPTLFHYPDVYRGSILNEAFATDLDTLINDSNISCWIFGHHHFNIADFRIGNTTLTTNQLGYVHNRENRGFGVDRVMEL